MAIFGAQRHLWQKRIAAGKKLGWVLALIAAAGAVLGACGRAATPARQPSEVTPQAAVAGPVTRTGAWVDRLIFVKQEVAAAAVKQIQAGEIDLYASSLADPNVLTMVKADPNLAYTRSLGARLEITCNPVAAFADGRINPFGVARFRQALNWLLDRDYIVREILGGLGVPSTLPLTTFSPDYGRYVDLARPLEAEYAYHPERARAQIAAVMADLGATLGPDRRWQYHGRPVRLIGLIRSEDTRRQIGDYLSSQLEASGFEVERQYKTGSEAAPIWGQSDPAEGLWSFYTGAWAGGAIARDEADRLAFFYTNLGSASPLWQAYRPSPELDAVARRLWAGDLATMEERRRLFEEALPLAMQDSAHLFLADQAAFMPHDAGLELAFGPAGGASLLQLYPFTLRRSGQEGGEVRIALADLLVAPWNPIAGSSWLHDTVPQYATADVGVMADPYSGLYWPQRFEKAECVVKTGFPVGRSLEWVTLTLADKIEVAADAWADWDAEAQTFVQAGQMPSPAREANSRCTVTYPRDLWTKVRWHDGSPISPADFVMRMIMAFDPGKKASPIYDQAQAPTVDAFLSHFRGVQIESTDPLAITTYDDGYWLDVESMAGLATWWPYYDHGQAPWSTVALGVMAEAAGRAAFSTDKAQAQNVEWLSFVAGPSLAVLKAELDGASLQGSIVYTATLSQYLTPEEIAGRYANLAAWYERQGHFWIGTGPFWLDGVFPTEKTLTLRRFEAYPDAAGRWQRLGTAMIPVVEVSGPARVKAGSAASFDLSITFDGRPYPPQQIAAVRFLLFDVSGALAFQGEAAAGGDGRYVAALGPEVTGRLPAGSSRLEVLVTSKAVGAPTVAGVEFVSDE